MVVQEVTDTTATINVNGVFLSFILIKDIKGKLKLRLFSKSGFGGDNNIPRQLLQKATKQAAAILKGKAQKQIKNSTTA